MSVFGKIDRISERRVSARRQVRRTGAAVAIGGSSSVIVDNVSNLGAMLYGRKLPGVGRDILVKVDDAELFGQVVWAAFDQRGVQFEDEAPA